MQALKLSPWQDNQNDNGAFRADKKSGEIFCSVEELDDGILIRFRNEMGRMIVYPELIGTTPGFKRMDAALKAMQICEDYLAANYIFECDVNGYRERMIKEIEEEGKNPAEYLDIAA